MGAGLEFPIGPGLEFAHRCTQSQAVGLAYRGSLGRGAFLTPPAHRRGVSALCWEAMEDQEKREVSLAELYHLDAFKVSLSLLGVGEDLL